MYVSLDSELVLKHNEAVLHKEKFETDISVTRIRSEGLCHEQEFNFFFVVVEHFYL